MKIRTTRYIFWGKYDKPSKLKFIAVSIEEFNNISAF